MRKYIAYYRVSTARQGESGLGLDAQKQVVESFVRSCQGEIVGVFEEQESGKKNDRVQLAAAIEATKEQGATLVIQKLDRLTRDVAFAFTLRDSGVDFVCCDNPNANTLTIGVIAVMAQHEREEISKRTKAALAQAKVRGVKLGTPQNLGADAFANSLAVRQRNAREHANNKRAMHVIELEMKNGAKLMHVAERLNEQGFRTRRNCKFTATQVKRLYDRLQTA
ncbi:MAG: recombinase family protein [Candidatus Kapaibacterium sp.]|jgi:DNA invertase Pin-like site-specific DNA recombinase